MGFDDQMRLDFLKDTNINNSFVQIQSNISVGMHPFLNRRLSYRIFTDSHLEFYHKHGYVHIKSFITPQQCQAAVSRIDEIIKQQIKVEKKMNLFGDDFRQTLVDSADKVKLFYEAKGVDENGNLVTDRERAVNKIGHNLHELQPIFEQITYTKKAEEILRKMKFVSPCVPQSMAILKPPRIGGEVNVHQDSTFLITTPDTLMAFWIPLQKCTIENGCLWALSNQSPNTPVYKQIRNNVMQQLHEEPDWEKEKFQPVEMEAGDVIMFHGKMVHKSHANTSDKSRYAYTWHLYDAGRSQWENGNWIPFRNFKRYY